MVAAAAKLYGAVRQFAGQIAAMVQPTGLSKSPEPFGGGYEALFCQSRLVGVTAGNTRAADIEFPSHAVGHRPQVPVQQIDRRVGNGRADRDERAGVMAGVIGVDHAADCGFSGAVFVVHTERLFEILRDGGAESGLQILSS